MSSSCSLIVGSSPNPLFSNQELKEVLERGNDEEKREAMKQTINMLVNGEPLPPSLLMIIIRYVMTTRDLVLKKLIMIYFEVVPKTGPDGKLLGEMILVCNALRNDLIHPNEYIRGCALRLITKLKEEELLLPLVPSVRHNLEHRHLYVRRAAVMAIFYLYKNFDHLIPDATELIYSFLSVETDPSSKRNAFVMLYHCDQDKAVAFLSEVLDQVASFGDILQIIVVQLIRKAYKRYPQDRARHVRCIYTLLNSSSPAVRFEAASTLILLSTASPAIKASASTFIQILSSQSDNNIKLVVLDKISGMKDQYKQQLQELVMELLVALGAPALEIRRKILEICGELVSSRNVDEVIQCLRKEITKSQARDAENGPEYRQLLIKAIHNCAIRFPEVASNVVMILMDFLNDANVDSAVDVVLFLREVIELHPDLREELLRKLAHSLRMIRAGVVFQSALWILGEYAQSKDDVDCCIVAIKKVWGPPLLTQQKDKEEEETTSQSNSNGDVPFSSSSSPASIKDSGSRVLADGTYASQSAHGGAAEVLAPHVALARQYPLRSLVLAGDYFLACSVANCLVKLVLKTKKFDVKESIKNSIQGNVLLIIASIMAYGEGKAGAGGAGTGGAGAIDNDSKRRLAACVRVLTSPNPALVRIFLEDCHSALQKFLEEKKKNSEKTQNTGDVVQVDDPLVIQQLKPTKKGAMGDFAEGEDDLEADVDNAASGGQKTDQLQQPRIYQLTGYSDPIYAEVNMVVHQFDILFDIMVFNQTPDTLQNVSLELSTVGDLKLVERLQTYTIGPNDCISICANIKVSSTENGIIFGNIVYDVSGSASVDSNCVVLNDIHIDIMDYIHPAICSESQFRSMWAEFEWENKVAVHTNITDVREYLRHIMKSTNMSCLTPSAMVEDDCGFLAANLYAKSVFGEHALLNLGVEKQSNGQIVGHVRIRSKTQGIALSLGDKITQNQRLSE